MTWSTTKWCKIGKSQASMVNNAPKNIWMRKSNLDIEIVTSFLLLSSSIEKIINIMIEGIKRKNKNKKRMHTFKWLPSNDFWHMPKTKAPLQGHPKGMKLNIAMATLLKMHYNAQGSFTKFPSKKGKMRKKN
jgi:hypothetical protein